MKNEHKEKYFNLTERKAVRFLIITLLLMTVMQLAWHLKPRSQSEIEKCQMVLQKHHIESIMLNNKAIFNYIDTTTNHAASWVNKYRLVPSCYGMFIAECQPNTEKKTREKDIRQIVNSKKSELEKDIKRLKKESDELEYYLRAHGVQDEGYDMVIRHHENIKNKISEKSQLLDTLKNNTDFSKYSAKKQDSYLALYRDRRNNVTKKACRLVKKLSGSQQMFQTTDKTKPIGVRPRYYENTELIKPIMSMSDSLNRDLVRMCRAGVGKKFLPSHIYGLTTDSLHRHFLGLWDSDTLTEGVRKDSLGTYTGQFNKLGQANGHGSYDSRDHSFYEGHWISDMRDGFGFSSEPRKSARTGEWAENIFKGERLNYTSDRIYGIDISRYQHDIGKKKYGIDWSNLRITQLGHISKKRISGKVNYPVSFVYIKSTEGTTILNKYYNSDYIAARKHGKRVGAYHFFSTKSGAVAQANYFLKHTHLKRGDFPPVLDVEPTHKQIMDMGGPEVLLNRIRTWLRLVENATGCRPILYVGQSFVNRYLVDAPDIKKRYNIWIARYGEYKPDVHLIYWQLSPDGRVNGIQGDVDINVFNGYKATFNEFLKTQLIP